ncbi:MAG: NADH-quinone oxidoreductase subunit J [Halobacteriales archaeon]
MAATTYELAAFGLFAAVTVGASLGVVLVRDVWHSALLLGVALLSVAVHFVMLRAEFVAAMQILVYVGGVLILISFAVMLVRRQTDDPALTTSPQLNLGGHLWRGVGAVALFAVLAVVALRAALGTAAGFGADASITASIGYAMFALSGADVPAEPFLVAFEIIDVVLVAALVAAVMLARRETGGSLLDALRIEGGEEP